MIRAGFIQRIPVPVQTVLDSITHSAVREMNPRKAVVGIGALKHPTMKEG